MAELVGQNEKITWDIVRTLAKRIDKCWEDKVEKDDHDCMLSTVVEFPKPIAELQHRVSDPWAKHLTNDSRTKGVPSLIADYTAPFRPDNLGSEHDFYQHWEIAYPHAEENAASYASCSKLGTVFAQYCVPNLTTPYPKSTEDFQCVGAFTYTMLYNGEGDRYASKLNALLLMESPRHIVKRFWHDDVNCDAVNGGKDTPSSLADDTEYSAELYVVSEGKNHEGKLVVCKNVMRIDQAVADSNGNFNSETSSGTEISTLCPAAGQNTEPVDTSDADGTGDSYHYIPVTLTERGWDQMKPVCDGDANTYPPPPIGCCYDAWFPRLGEEIDPEVKENSWFPTSILKIREQFSMSSDYVKHMQKVDIEQAKKYALDTYGVDIVPRLADEAIDKDDCHLHVYNHLYVTDKVSYHIGVRISLLLFGHTSEKAVGLNGKPIQSDPNHDARWCITGITVGIRGKIYPAIRKRWWDMMYYKARCIYGYLYSDPDNLGAYRAIGVTPNKQLRQKVIEGLKNIASNNDKYINAWVDNRLISLHNSALGTCGMFGVSCQSDIDDPAKSYTGADYGEYQSSKKFNIITKGENADTATFNEAAYFGIPYFEQMLCGLNAADKPGGVKCSSLPDSEVVNSKKGGYCSDYEDGPKYEYEPACDLELYLPWYGGGEAESGGCDTDASAYRAYANTVNSLDNIVDIIEKHKIAEKDTLAIGSVVAMEDTMQVAAVKAHGRMSFPFLPEPIRPAGAVAKATVEINERKDAEHIDITPSGNKVDIELDCTLDYTDQGVKNTSYLISVPVFANEEVSVRVTSNGMYNLIPTTYHSCYEDNSSGGDSNDGGADNHSGGSTKGAIGSVVGGQPQASGADKKYSFIGPALVGSCHKNVRWHPGVISTSYAIIPDINQEAVITSCQKNSDAPEISADDPLEYGETNSIFQKVYYPVYSADGYKNPDIYGIGVGTGKYFVADEVFFSDIACDVDVVAMTDAGSIADWDIEASTLTFSGGEIKDTIEIRKDAVNRALRGKNSKDSVVHKDSYNGLLVVGVNACLQSHFSYASLLNNCGEVTADSDEFEGYKLSCGSIPSGSDYPRCYDYSGKEPKEIPCEHKLFDEGEAVPALADRGTTITISITKTPKGDVSGDYESSGSTSEGESGEPSEGEPSEGGTDDAEPDPDFGDEGAEAPCGDVVLPARPPKKKKEDDDDDDDDDEEDEDPSNPDGPNYDPDDVKPKPWDTGRDEYLYFVAGTNCSVSPAGYEFAGDEGYPKFKVTSNPIGVTDLVRTVDYKVRYDAKSVGVGACTAHADNNDCSDNAILWGFTDDFVYTATTQYKSRKCGEENTHVKPSKTTEPISKKIRFENITASSFTFYLSSFGFTPGSGDADNDAVSFVNTGRRKLIRVVNKQNHTSVVKNAYVVEVNVRAGVIRQKTRDQLKRTSGAAAYPEKTIKVKSGTQGEPDIDAKCTATPKGKLPTGKGINMPPGSSKIRIRFDQTVDGSSKIDNRTFSASERWHTKETWGQCYSDDHSDRGAPQSGALDVTFKTEVPTSKGNIIPLS